MALPNAADRYLKYIASPPIIYCKKRRNVLEQNRNNIKNVIKKYSPSARVNGLNKEKLLQLLEDIRKTNNITNADLCNKFADEIYLPKIVLKKADIPLSLRSQFIDLR